MTTPSTPSPHSSAPDPAQPYKKLNSPDFIAFFAEKLAVQLYRRTYRQEYGSKKG